MKRMVAMVGAVMAAFALTGVPAMADDPPSTDCFVIEGIATGSGVAALLSLSGLQGTAGATSATVTADQLAHIAKLFPVVLEPTTSGGCQTVIVR